MDFILTAHAEERMSERQVDPQDIQEIGFTCFHREEQTDGKWLICGQDMEKEDLAIIAAYTGDTVIITVMDVPDRIIRGDE